MDSYQAPTLLAEWRPGRWNGVGRGQGGLVAHVITNPGVNV